VKVTLRRYGRQALLVQPRQRRTVLALADALRTVPGVTEVVPAARTVLIHCAAPSCVDDVREHVQRVAAALVGAAPPARDEIVLDVRYDGADLADTARLVDLDVDGLVRAHSEAGYVVAFCGFAPGFAYLTGLPKRLRVPRLPEPRTRVPAGSVGVAGEFTGVYPRSSPGGWRLLGHTDAPLWDLSRDPPALLPPGTRVRFRPA
jgi:KipI family sensor histidine kinase inhibitor